MMHVLPCADVRQRLEAYLDGELPLGQQVRMQEHLQECVACRLEADDLATIGQVLRGTASPRGARLPAEANRLVAAVLERVRVERQLSFVSQVRGLFEDMHLVWAGLGATVAMVICVFASAGVLHAASSERPDSLAGMITYLANPGSNDNPVRLDGFTSIPRAHDDTTMPLTTEDAEVAIAAVVTREGRIRNLEILMAEQAQPLRGKPEVVWAMVDAAARARFEPAKTGGAPVAVSMVWLLSTTTVKGSSDYDLHLTRPLPNVQHRKPRPVAPPAPKVSPTGDIGSPMAAG